MVVLNAKQQKITKIWRKQASREILEDFEDLEGEIKELEQKLQEKQSELFQVQRNSCKRKVASSSSQSKRICKPMNITENHYKVHIERNIEMMTMMTGIEVKSYTQEQCVIIYHMQHQAPHSTMHGLQIDTKSGEDTVSKYSMPLGFNFKDVVEEFERIRASDCLEYIRNALVAYYDRLQQFEALKSLVTIDGQLFKVMDTTHVEISFKVQMIDEEAYEVVLTLDYRVYDIRPKLFSIKGSELEQPALDVLEEQCAVFKKKPLQDAFVECFMEDHGPYSIVRMANPMAAAARRRRKQHKRRPQQPYNPNNDDTFRPEDCSDSSEEDDDRELRQTYGRR